MDCRPKLVLQIAYASNTSATDHYAQLRSQQMPQCLPRATYEVCRGERTTEQDSLAVGERVLGKK